MTHPPINPDGRPNKEEVQEGVCPFHRWETWRPEKHRPWQGGPELRCGVWCVRRPGHPSQTRAGGIRHLTLPAGSSQWLGLPRRGRQAGHRKPATEWPHPSWGLSGELTPLKLSAQPYGFIKKLWPGAMPVFPSAFFQRVHTVLSKLNMPRPGGGPGSASS